MYKCMNYIRMLKFNDWITILVLFMFIGIYVYVTYRSDKRIDEGMTEINLLQIAEFVISYIFIFVIVLIVMQKIFPSNILNDAVSFLTGE